MGYGRSAMTAESCIRFHNGLAVMYRLARHTTSLIWIKYSDGMSDVVLMRARLSRHPWLHIAPAASCRREPHSDFVNTSSLQPLLHMMLSSAAMAARPALKWPGRDEIRKTRISVLYNGIANILIIFWAAQIDIRLVYLKK